MYYPLHLIATVIPNKKKLSIIIVRGVNFFNDFSALKQVIISIKI